MKGLAITLRNVLYRHDNGGGWQVRFDAAFAAGRITAILGPSGAGKTTLLNIVAGFLVPHEGRILFGEDDLSCAAPAQRPVSMIFQENNLFAHLDVATNVALGIAPDGHFDAVTRRRVSQALQQVGLQGYEQRLPATLSGGERQRVAIARALLRNRPVMLLDEPFAALDPALRGEMAALLRRIHEQHGYTILLVSHQPREAARLAEDFVFIDAGRIAVRGSMRQLNELAARHAMLASYLGHAR